jgi:amidase
MVKRLTDAGMVILGKTNLSEWANIRSNHSISGWSAVGGTVRNPYVLDRSACGSSSGSGAAVAAGLAPAAIGTETDGSITCPAAINGLVGLKPTVGLVSRTHIVPISHSQDTAGPMTRTVTDAALVLTAIAGSDPADVGDQGRRRPQDRLRQGPGQGRAEGRDPGRRPLLHRLFAKHGRGVRAGAEGPQGPGRDPGRRQGFRRRPDRQGRGRGALYRAEGRPERLPGLDRPEEGQDPHAGRPDRLQQGHAQGAGMVRPGELREGPEATKGYDDPDYIKAVADGKRLAGPEGIDKILKDTGAVAIVAPTTGPAWTIDPLNGDHYGGSSTTLPAVAGYPHLTVPMGDVTGLPVGLSFIGPAWSEAGC